MGMNCGSLLKLYGRLLNYASQGEEMNIMTKRWKETWKGPRVLFTSTVKFYDVYSITVSIYLREMLSLKQPI